MRNDENGKRIGKEIEVKRKRQADRQTKRVTETGRQKQAGRCKFIK